MKTEQFAQWLKETKKYKKNVIQSRVSNCHRVEKYYADLDAHYRKDGGRHLSTSFSYSTRDEREKRLTLHVVPINGNLRTGTATLKQAIKLYIQFKRQASIS
ncbi:MAG: hypothetical protein WCK09_21435 [Bacteroidota bacterium]